jgi:hypothetical protein
LFDHFLDIPQAVGPRGEIFARQRTRLAPSTAVQQPVPVSAEFVATAGVLLGVPATLATAASRPGIAPRAVLEAPAALAVLGGLAFAVRAAGGALPLSAPLSAPLATLAGGVA